MDTVGELFPWQQSQWQQVMQRKAAARMPHALLLCGPAGLGKQQFAHYLIQAVLCKLPQSADYPCGRCRSCRLFLAGSHPDFLGIAPEEENKPIKVDQARQVATFLNHTSQYGGYKTVLFTAAERMNVNAANSLLKTLEEPSANSLLLLVTDIPAKLPATVRSRCQALVFSRPETATAVTWLATRTDTGDDPRLLLGLGGGAPLQALRYADHGVLQRRRELFVCFCDVLANRIDPVEAAQRWNMADLADTVIWMIGWQMDMIRLKMMTAPPYFHNLDLQDDLRRLAAGLSAQALFQQLDASIRLRELSATQVNPEFMLEAFFSACARA